MSGDIRQFFSKKRNLDDESTSADDSEAKRTKLDVQFQSVPVADVSSSSFVLQNDICRFSNRRLTDSEREYILRNAWAPPDNFEFPTMSSDHTSMDRKLKFQKKWLEDYSWLTYSKIENGAYCLPCVVFAECGGKHSRPLGHLVKSKFDKWKKAREVFSDHQIKVYHVNAVADVNNFLERIDNPDKSIINTLDHGRAKKVAENRRNLEPIVQAIIMLGRQGLALRGHRDCGPIHVDEQFTGPNGGNFRAMLGFRALGDANLRSRLESSDRIKYLSPKIQNEVISACYDIIIRKIVSKINTAKYFSILSDETTDVSTTEQVTICARYLDPETTTLREDFLMFLPTTSTKGRDLAHLILKNLADLGIDCQHLIGQGYDGAPNMSGAFNGVQAAVREKHPKALYVHCASHCLNLAICAASSVPSIRNCLGTIETIYNYFNTPKKQNEMLKAIEELAYESEVRTMKRLNVTRWVAKLEAVNDFFALIEVVVRALENIHAEERDKHAYALLKSIDFEFLISLVVVNAMYQRTLPLSRKLQGVSLDLRAAVNLTDDVLSEMCECRTEVFFCDLYETATTTANTIGVDIVRPRIAKRQSNRANPDVETSEQYYRTSTFYPFLDYYISELKEKFTSLKEALVGYQAMFAEDYQHHLKDFEEVVKFYAMFLENSPENVVVELKMWRRYLQRLGMYPKTAFKALSNCPAEFPSVRTLLSILVTLPVTTAEAERSFSCLKRLKTYLRNTTSETRLNGLAILNVHGDIGITTSEVINLLATKPRKFELMIN